MRRRDRCSGAFNARGFQLIEYVLRDLGDQFGRDIGLEGISYSLVDGLGLDTNILWHSAFATSSRVLPGSRWLWIELTVSAAGIVESWMRLPGSVVMSLRVVISHDRRRGCRGGRILQ